MIMKKRLLALCLACLMLAGCSSTAADMPKETEAPVTTVSVTEETAPPTTLPDVAEEKEVVIYFANWYLETKTAEEGAEVCSIPWDKITYVNHAFWEIRPDDGSVETSWELLEQKKPPRTKFCIGSTLDKADFEDQTPSEMAEGLPRNHFAQYAVYAEKYPEVNILISIGGWTRCGYFSEMAYTAEGRHSFVESCMELMEKYPWIDGFDIDWEYFGGSKDGARRPEDDNDQGCPIWGTVEEDSENFGLLCKELRETMDAVYGPGVKKLTGCASASTGWTLPMQNWRLVEPYMDLINIMSYDMAGVWDHVTGHASREQHCRDAINVMHRGYKVPYRKMTIGTPMYATDLKMVKLSPSGSPVGAMVESTAPSKEEIYQEMLRAWEKEAVSGYAIDWVDGKPQIGESFQNEGVGWHYSYDKFLKGAYMWNDDPNSPYYLWYLSYETPVTLQQKIDLVKETGIAGMIMWEISQDTYEQDNIKQIAENLLN